MKDIEPIGDDLTIGRAIRLLRTTAGLSQKDLADRVSVNRTYVSHLEAGRRDPSLSLMKTIAHALEVPPGLLLAVALWADLPKEERDRYGKLIRDLLETAGAAQFLLFDRQRDPGHAE